MADKENAAEEVPKTEEAEGTASEENDVDKKEEEAGGDEKKAEEPPKKEMRAVVLTGFGGLKSVKVLQRQEPTISKGELLIRVKACGLNFQDLMLRQGIIDSPSKTPFILGFECAGEVAEVGEEVEGFEVGDRVVALPEYRAWSELVVVPAQYVYKLPEGLDFLNAAALTMNYVVAYILLFDLAGLSDGKSILVHSAGGGVGQAVAQLCRTLSDVKIYGVASKGKHEELNGTIDHLLDRSTDYVSEVRKTSPEGLDIVLDCMCGDECTKGYSLLKPMGRYILYGSSNVVTGETKSLLSAAKTWWQVEKVAPTKLFEENKSIAGFNLRHFLYKQNGAVYVKEVVEKLFDLWKQEKIKPRVDSTWALEDVAQAMQKIHERKNIGKIILDPSLEPKPKPVTPSKSKNKSDDKSKNKDKDDKKEDKKDEKKEDEKDKEEKEQEKEEESKSDNGDKKAEEAKENGS